MFVIVCLRMDKQAIVVYRGGKLGGRGARGSAREISRVSGRDGGIFINNLDDDIQQEFIKFLLEKNQSQAEVEKDLSIKSQESNDLLSKLKELNDWPPKSNESNDFKLDHAKLKEFVDKVDTLNKTIGFFRIVADITIITSSIISN
jgi:hypothetical protein